MVTAIATLLIAFCAIPAAAQEPAADDRATSEELEPVVVGIRGTTLVGVSGFVDRPISSETQFATAYSGHLDVLRFLTRRIAAGGGVSGAGRFGGTDDPDDSDARGRGSTAHAFASAVYYFTPQSIASFYGGAAYWLQLTRRDDRDRGSVFGIAGIQGQLSSRAAMFIESGYGVGLTRGSEEELVTRIVGRVGFRLKF